ncbi:MAG: hypothetical protein P8X89_07030 [Reinekea sp.]
MACALRRYEVTGSGITESTNVDNHSFVNVKPVQALCFKREHSFDFCVRGEASLCGGLQCYGLLRNLHDHYEYPIDKR